MADSPLLTGIRESFFPQGRPNWAHKRSFGPNRCFGWIASERSATLAGMDGIDWASFGSRIEIAAAILGLINIALLVARSVWNYPFGMAMVSLYAFVFFEAKLYGNAALQIFFFAVQVYGWRQWVKALDRDNRVIVARMSANEMLIAAGLIAIGIFSAGQFLAARPDASYPYWDAAITVISVGAQIQLARRRLENWILWIIVDILAVGLFWTKGLHPTALLYGVFLVFATIGFFSWRRAGRSTA